MSEKMPVGMRVDEAFLRQCGRKARMMCSGIGGASVLIIWVAYLRGDPDFAGWGWHDAAGLMVFMAVFMGIFAAIAPRLFAFFVRDWCVVVTADQVRVFFGKFRSFPLGREPLHLVREVRRKTWRLVAGRKSRRLPMAAFPALDLLLKSEVPAHQLEITDDAR